jgi:hypothetical protein
VHRMAENLIESMEPLLTPPVMRYPTGVSESDDGDVVESIPCCCCFTDDGDDD